MVATLERNSNFELLRLFSMFLVLLHHGNFPALGVPTQAKFILDPMWISFRTLMESMSLVCVNLFVLISGWFSIKFKPKGVFNLVFTAAFYSWLIAVVVILVHYIMGGVKLDKVWVCAFPLMGSNWFVLQYLILYIISPMLNVFEESVSKTYMRNFLLFAFGINVYVGYVCHNAPFGNGYNFILMASIYLLGRYMRHHYEEQLKDIPYFKLIMMYLLSSIVFSVFMYFWYIRTSHEWPFLYAYNNPLIIISSVAVFGIFAKLNIKSQPINRFATSCLAILLIHMHPLVGNYYYWLMQIIDSNNHLLSLFLMFSVIFLIMILSFFIDRIRILSMTSIAKHLKFCDE